MQTIFDGRAPRAGLLNELLYQDKTRLQIGTASHQKKWALVRRSENPGAKGQVRRLPKRHGFTLASMACFNEE